MINFAIIGCGHVAKKHADAIDEVDGSQLVAVCDKVEENMNIFTEKHGAKGYSNFHEMIQDEKIDVVCICTPSGSHALIAEAVASAGKHIIMEKPMALTVTDAERMIQICKENGVKLAVVHPNRFRPVMMEVKKVVEQGLLGKLSHVNATVRWNRNQTYYDQAEWRGTKEHDGGVLMNQAIHNLDLLLWLFGDIEEVFSMSDTRLRNIEAEDVSVGVARFKNGALGVIEAATTIYPENLEETISIFGEKGTIKIGGTTANYVEHWDVEAMDDQETNQLIDKVKADPYGKPGHQWIIEDMVHAIQTDREPIVSGSDGLKALQLVTSMYESAERSTKVTIYEKVTN